MEDLLKKISAKIKKTADDVVPYEDLYYIAKDNMSENKAVALPYLKFLSNTIENKIPTTKDDKDLLFLFELHKKVLLTLSRDDFESYLLYVEWNRQPEKKFYPPRRKVLKQVVDNLQELADDKLDLLAVSLPPGSGKTTLAIFFLTWLAGKRPNEPKLTGSHSNSFVRGVYDECLRIFEPNGDYLWYDVFPNIGVTGTNAKDCRIDIDKRQRFETLEFTSIGTGNAGLYRASDLLYCDDLVSGIEVALSKERLDKLWETYTTDLRQRKIGNVCKELHIATRWSVHDVIGRLEREYGDSERAKFIIVPALDENDESNFDYAYGVGFSTKFYHEQREIMEDASWKALYMNEPIERDGILYQKDELRRYFDLPDSEPDSIITVCDTKDRGADYCCMPIAYQYGQNYFIEDILCDNNKPEIVDMRLVEILLKHKVKLARFESNSAGGRVAQTVQAEVKKQGGITHITTKFTTSNKETKIIVNSPFCKEHFLFKDESVYPNRDYKRAMDMLCSYTMMGKNKHDDVPDALSQLVEYIQSLQSGKVEVFQRPW
ncbi:MAG: phage terminase large subunit [Peptostreptococcaceae bacterium]|nr:phage terminase large subunit [Peptostreptococcaceae bacterium]